MAVILQPAVSNDRCEPAAYLYTLTADETAVAYPPNEPMLISSSAIPGRRPPQLRTVTSGAAAFVLSFGATTPTVTAGLQISYSVNLPNSGSGPKLNGDPLTVVITPDSRLTSVSGQGPMGAWKCTPQSRHSMR